jgi:hypothetical protein
MLRQLNRIGIFDNEKGRNYLWQTLWQQYYNNSGVVQSNGRVVRDMLLNGPNGSVKLETIWEGAKLITMEIFGG